MQIDHGEMPFSAHPRNAEFKSEEYRIANQIWVGMGRHLCPNVLSFFSTGRGTTLILAIPIPMSLDLRENIARNLDTVLPDAKISTGDAKHGQLSSIRSVAFRKGDYVVFYERGVGTGAFMDRWVGGAFGEGITQNIRRAYKFLYFTIYPGDQIFIFAFSRGAYTARSLIGYIHATGLLTREHCTEDREQDAWDFYRCPPNDKLPGIWTALTPYVHDRDSTRVACVGIFDTVGALGVPLAPFRVANRDKYEFHDVELSSITDTNLQALAVDEHREPFEATVWRRSKLNSWTQLQNKCGFRVGMLMSAVAMSMKPRALIAPEVF